MLLLGKIKIINLQMLFTISVLGVIWNLDLQMTFGQ